jgi:hypothetical protein
MAHRPKTPPPPAELVRGRSKSFTQDEELAAQRRREQSITFDNVAGLEELSEENLSAIRDLFNRHLHCTLAKDVAVATERDYYLSLSYTVRDHVMVSTGRLEKEKEGKKSREEREDIVTFSPLFPLLFVRFSFSPFFLRWMTRERERERDG